MKNSELLKLVLIQFNNDKKAFSICSVVSWLSANNKISPFEKNILNNIIQNNIVLYRNSIKGIIKLIDIYQSYKYTPYLMPYKEDPYWTQNCRLSRILYLKWLIKKQKQIEAYIK